MEGVSTFLESSTIHGLNYISTTKKYTRLFWILIISTGFLLAFLLIKESFDSWSERPFSTTVETLPIAEIKLPKVTVCPPKNTFTDLNYDLIMTENMSLTKGMRDEMFKYALEVINEESYSENNWTKLHEEDRFFNWYHGYTRIKAPYIDSRIGQSYDIETSVTSGVIATQYFGEQFMSDLVERNFVPLVNVYPPGSVRDNVNVTLHFNVEKVSMTKLSRKSRERYFLEGHPLTDDQTNVNLNFTPPLSGPQGYYNSDYRQIRAWRRVSSGEVEKQKLDLMPGFRFTWWHSGEEVTADPRFRDEEITKQLIR